MLIVAVVGLALGTYMAWRRWAERERFALGRIAIGGVERLRPGDAAGGEGR